MGQRGGHHPHAVSERGRRRKSYDFNSSSFFTSRAPIPCSRQQQVLTNPTPPQLKSVGQGRKIVLLLSFHIWLSPGWPWGFHNPWGHVAVGAQLCSPRSGWGHPHQRPSRAPDQAPGSCCTARSGCAAACCHCCRFPHLFLSWKYILKKHQEGHPGHFHKQRRVRGDEGKRDVCSPSPSEQRPATNLPLFTSHVYPSLATSTQQLFPACCEKQVSHLSLQLVVSTNLI